MLWVDGGRKGGRRLIGGVDIRPKMVVSDGEGVWRQEEEEEEEDRVDIGDLHFAMCSLFGDKEY